MMPIGTLSFSCSLRAKMNPTAEKAFTEFGVHTNQLPPFKSSCGIGMFFSFTFRNRMPG